MGEEEVYVDDNDNQNEGSPKKSPLKILIGLIILATIAVFVIWKTSAYFRKDEPNKYISTLNEYYLSMARDDSNAMSLLTVDTFTDKSASYSLKPGQFDLFVYEILEPDSDVGNYDKEIIYSISIRNATPSLSYVNAAYFTDKDTETQIALIENIYSGKSYLE